MAIVTRQVCDWLETGEQHEATTRHFGGFDGSTYEIDLCDLHFAEAESIMAKLTKAARNAAPRKTPKVAAAVANRPTAPVAKGAGGGAVAYGLDATKVTEWAKETGMIPRDRHGGRLSTKVVEAYIKANPVAQR